MPEAALLGQRLRAERVRRDVSLRQLARQVGVSASMISQIETGKARPSVRTLYSITSVLGVSLEALFAGLGRSAEPAPGSPADRLGPLVEAQNRTTLVLESGVSWEHLGRLRHCDVDFVFARYPPGACSSGAEEMMAHAGCEYGYLLHGRLVLTLGFEELVVHPGDALSFDSATPHRYRNDGAVEAAGVWLVVR
jgi:transcriptional regulator with XRE-family HTH domain